MNYQEILAKYADKPGGMIEAFHAIQEELNYLPEEVIIEAAKVFNKPTAQAYGVATFTPCFRLPSAESM